MATLRDRYGDAKDVAGQAANNKAALANKQAKQAAAMSNNSKMTQALLGSAAANEAIAGTYDQGMQTGAQMASQVANEELQKQNLEQQQKQFEEQLKSTKEENEKERQSRYHQLAMQAAVSTLGGLFK